MSGRAAVVLYLRFAMVGGEGDEADCLCGDIKIVLDEALMVVEYLNYGVPLACFVLCFNLIVLNEALGEAEGGIIMACCHKEDHRGVQTVWVTVGIFAVKVAVEYQTNAADMSGLVECIGDSLVGLAVVAVIVAPDAAVKTVQKCGAISVISSEGCLFGKLGGLAAEAGKEAVVIHEDLLDLLDLLRADLTGSEIILCCNSCCSTYCLSDNADSAHYARAAEADVRCADVSAREHKVFNVLGVEGTERDGVRLGKAALLKMSATLCIHMESAGEVVVDLPTAVSNRILKARTIFNVVLGDDVITDITAALALTGKESDEFEIPIFCTVVSVVLDMVPNAECDLEKLVADLLGVIDGVLHTAKLDPIEVGVHLIDLVGLVVHRVIIGEVVCPSGRSVADGMIGLAALDHKAHSHGVVVCDLKSEFLAELALCLAAYAIFRARKGREDRVARAVDEA